MMLIYEGFAGLAPKISPKRLADGMATIAENVRLDRGRLESWRGLLPLNESVPSNSRSLFLYNGDWLSWSTDVDVVEKITPNDVRDRIVYTGDGYPKIRSGNEVYRLGIPIPETLAATVTTEGDKSQLTYVRNQSYRASYVDVWGAEGALSPPSNSVEVGLDSESEVSLPSVPVGNFNFGAGARMRIYRSNSGTDSGLWQLAGEVPITQDSFTDTKNPGDLQEAAITENWIGPPDDDTSLYPKGALQGLIALPNGSLAGFAGNVVSVSYPYVPHAWPADYRVTIPDGNIVGLSVLPTGILVLTDKQPYMIQGSSAAAMTPIRLDSKQACVSKESIVNMGGYTVFASPDGLCIAEGNQITLATETFFTKHEWLDYEPDSIRAWMYEGKYLARYGSGSQGFVYHPAGDTHTFTTLDWPVEAAHLAVEDDALYVAEADGNISEFDAGLPMMATWQSGVKVLNDPLGFNVLRVESDQFPVSVTVYGDGKVRFQGDVKNNKPVRMPAGFKSKTVQVKIAGTNPVDYLVLSDSMQELI